MSTPQGVWVAWYSDMSGIYIYRREIDALRKAVDSWMQVSWWPFGTSIQEVQRDERDD